MKKKELNWRALGVAFIVMFCMLVPAYIYFGVKSNKLKKENEILKASGCQNLKDTEEPIPIKIVCKDNFGDGISLIFNENGNWWGALNYQVKGMNEAWEFNNYSKRIESCEVVR